MISTAQASVALQDEASPHVKALTDQWMGWASADGCCRCDPAVFLSAPDDPRFHVMASFR